MTAPTIRETPAVQTAVALDFHPHGERYTQFVLHALEPLVDVTVSVAFFAHPGNVIDGDVRTFRRGALLPGQPLVFCPPGSELGGMDVDEMLGAYASLEVLVARGNRQYVARIEDLAYEWERLREAGIVETITDAETAAKSSRRLATEFENALKRHVAGALNAHSSAIGSAARQLVAAQQPKRWSLVEDHELMTLYLAVRRMDAEGVEAFEPWTYEHAHYPLLAFVRDELRRELRQRGINLDPPAPA
jgi:hypothetical protein